MIVLFFDDPIILKLIKLNEKTIYNILQIELLTWYLIYLLVFIHIIYALKN